MQSSVGYLNGYTELWGTPGLKPMTAYNLNGSYILKQKYIFNLFFMHTSDYFVQAPYQSTERLALIYKNTNWNYMQLWGVNLILPFKAGNWLDSRLTMTGMQMLNVAITSLTFPLTGENGSSVVRWTTRLKSIKTSLSS